MTIPAAETKSIGLPADALVVMVFASPSWQFYHDVTNPAHLSGLSHLDDFIVTRKSCPLTGTLQKRMPTPTRTATNPHHRAVRWHSSCKTETVYIREFSMTLNFCPSTGTQSSANFILTCPACPLALLHMIIHGFAFWKFPKPAHEHHLQVLPTRVSLVLFHLPGL